MFLVTTGSLYNTEEMSIVDAIRKLGSNKSIYITLYFYNDITYKEYKNLKHHILGAIIGIVIGIIVASLFVVYISIYYIIKKIVITLEIREK